MMIFHPVLEQVRELTQMGLMNGEDAKAPRRWSGTLDVAPAGKGRPRFTRNGRPYTPAKTLTKEAEIRHCLSMLDAPKFEGAVEFNVLATFVKPKSAPKKRKHHIVKPDCSNILKLVEDAANGLLYLDDKQIVISRIEKRYGDSESIQIEIKEVQ